MNDKLETMLLKAAVMTFEELGFMLPTPELDESQQRATAQAAVGVQFRGLFAGELVVLVCGDWLPLLAANMLGEDEPPSLLQQFDALGEIANIICGNVLPQIAGPQVIFNLSAPCPVEIPQMAAIDPECPAAKARLGLETGRAEVLLYLHSETA